MTGLGRRCRSGYGSLPPANQGPRKTPVSRVNASPLKNRRQAGRKIRPPRSCGVLCRCYKAWVVVVVGHPLAPPGKRHGSAWRPKLILYNAKRLLWIRVDSMILTNFKNLIASQRGVLRIRCEMWIAVVVGHPACSPWQAIERCLAAKLILYNAKRPLWIRVDSRTLRIQAHHKTGWSPP